MKKAKMSRIQAELEAMKNIVHKLKKQKKEKPARQPLVINNVPPAPAYMPPLQSGSGNDDITNLMKNRILNF